MVRLQVDYWSFNIRASCPAFKLPGWNFVAEGDSRLTALKKDQSNSQNRHTFLLRSSGVVGGITLNSTLLR